MKKKALQIQTVFAGVSLLFFMMIASGCATQLRIHSNFVPEGSLRLAQVVDLGKRADLIAYSKETYDAILASGVSDAEIVDGSVVLARVYCCGGITPEASSERVSAITLFVPSSLKVEQGDMVELRAGREPKKGMAGSINTVTRVVQKYEAKEEHCWWDPKNDRLWLRVAYCDWMPAEGWVKQGGDHPAWYKPVTTSPSQN